MGAFFSPSDSSVFAEAGAVSFPLKSVDENRQLPRTQNYQTAKKNAPITLEILDQKDRLSANIRPRHNRAKRSLTMKGGPRPPARGLPTEAGLNRFVLDLQYEGASRVPRSPALGRKHLTAGSASGNYQVRLTVNGKPQTSPLEIKPDPRLKVTQQDLEKQFDLLPQDS